jgi:hypothetical protein
MQVWPVAANTPGGNLASSISAASSIAEVGE